MYVEYALRALNYICTYLTGRVKLHTNLNVNVPWICPVQTMWQCSSHSHQDDDTD